MYKLSRYISFIILVFYSTLLSQPIVVPDRLGDRLRIGYVYNSPTDLSPMVAKSDYEREFHQLVFGDGIFSRAAEGYVTHGLALSSELEQPAIWRINLRSDIKFHDGSEITSADIKFSFELYKKFALQSNLLFDVRLIKTIDILNPKSLRIYLTRPYRDFRETIGQLPILPQKYYHSWMNYNLLSSLPYIEPRGNGHFLYRQRETSQVYQIALWHYLIRLVFVHKDHTPGHALTACFAPAYLTHFGSHHLYPKLPDQLYVALLGLRIVLSFSHSN